jgi:hypothetical protein
MHDRSRFASREVTPTCSSWLLFFLIIFQIVVFFFFSFFYHSFYPRYEGHFNGVCLRTQNPTIIDTLTTVIGVRLASELC